MSSSSAVLDGGPVQLDWHKKNGASPQLLTAAVLGVLDQKHGPDCPPGLRPVRPRPDLLRPVWDQFLAMRERIANQVSSPLNSHVVASRTFLNLRCESVTAHEAVIDYLDYLPQVLIPQGADRYLPAARVAACQEWFRQLAERVADYIPGFREEAAALKLTCQTDLDASNAIGSLEALVQRFGDFTRDYRQARVGQSLADDYNLAIDILTKVSEVASRSRPVGPFERAMVHFWYHTRVPQALSRDLAETAPFLLDFQSTLSYIEAQRAFECVQSLLEELGSRIARRKMNEQQQNRQAIAASFGAMLDSAAASDPVSPATIFMLRAFWHSLPDLLRISLSERHETLIGLKTTPPLSDSA
jgi:hypothetical protein